MSLLGALNAGKSALATHQAALQVTGNNIANAGNADYTRQRAQVATSKDQEVRPGIFLGTGINLTAVQRQIDEALEGRLRGSISNTEGTATLQQWLGRIESVYNELSDEDLSTQLSKFFNAWSNLANKPQDAGLRQVVVQTGEAVAGWFQTIRTNFTNLQKDVDQRLVARTADADRLAQQVADLNQQIVVAEGGSGGQANGLRDQRDQILKQLSGLLDIKTTEESSGIVNVYVGSEPLVIGTNNRGVALKQETIDGELVSTVIFKADRGTIKHTSGEIGALAEVRSRHLESTIDTVDNLASNFIFELNKLHAAGQGLKGFSSVTGTTVVADTTAALGSAAADLDFQPVNGSFVVHVKNKQTGLMTSTMVQVDLDGAGADTSLDSLRADIDGIADISASVVGGQLRIATDSDNVEISFSQDSSGVLAALGINSFFAGRNARDIAVNNTIKTTPAMIAASGNGDTGDNQTARAIANLESAALKSLGGVNLKETYQAMVNDTAVAAAAAKTNADAATAVQQTLQAQRESLSGVSLDEEAINLIRQQRAFQGAAKLVSAVDELMQTILGLV
jgi:flagellar hook-associated protein 1 FlgK